MTLAQFISGMLWSALVQHDPHSGLSWDYNDPYWELYDHHTGLRC